MNSVVCKGWKLVAKIADHKICGSTDKLNDNGLCPSHVNQIIAIRILENGGKVCSNRIIKGCYNEIFDDISKLCDKCYVRKTNKCKGETKLGKPCPNFAKDDKIYCTTHSRIYGDSEPDKQIESDNKYPCVLADIKKCKNKVELKDTKCENCIQKYCNGISHSLKQCVYSKIGNTDYCIHHQKQADYHKMIKEGKKICSNAIRRGCYNEITDGYERCKVCRSSENISDKKRRDTRIIISEKFNSENTNEKMCKICPKIVNRLINNKCLDCYTNLTKCKFE